MTMALYEDGIDVSTNGFVKIINVNDRRIPKLSSAPNQGMKKSNFGPDSRFDRSGMMRSAAYRYRTDCQLRNETFSSFDLVQRMASGFDDRPR